MTFAPPKLVELGSYIVSRGAVNLGVVGDTAHAAKGTSYHLGQSQLLAGAYSTTHPRDREPALTEAASAIDIGKINGTLAGLQRFSVWLATQCANRAIDTLDIREVIYSPDGIAIRHWDAPTGATYPGGSGTGHGDDSHRTHTHVSFFRDSEFRDKLAVFRRYFEGEDDLDAKVDIPVGRVNVAAGGTVYANPEKSVVLIPVWVGAQNVQAYSQRPGPPAMTAIRIDPPNFGTDNITIGWVGSDKVTPVAAPVTDCGPAVTAATAPLQARIDAIKAKVAAVASDIADD